MRTSSQPIIQSATTEEVHSAVERVYARPEFRDEDSAFGKAWLEFRQWLGSLFEDVAPNADTVTSGVKVLWGLILIVATAMLAWGIWRYARGAAERMAREAAGAVDEVAARVQELRQQARTAEQSGDHTLALRLYFFALVIGLGQRGELEYSGAWTNRELLERGEPRAEVADVLRPLVGELDAHSFGDAPTQPAEVQRFAELCERLLGSSKA